jgi:steroid 5-alpha reductase family enzyme
MIILSTFVAIWSIRLGWFLFTRIHNNNGIDSRFTTIKAFLPRFLMAWTLQGVWVFFTMLPVLMLHQASEDFVFNVLDYIGIPVWIFGFTFEVISDYQKSAFRKLAENREKFIHTGLWSISRHPNYFGEIVLWIGVALCAFGGLGMKPKAGFVFISPIFVALLLIFISGIPLLEQKADKKYGDNDLYQHYKQTTPVLVPFIGRRGDAMF